MTDGAVDHRTQMDRLVPGPEAAFGQRWCSNLQTGSKPISRQQSSCGNACILLVVINNPQSCSSRLTGGPAHRMVRPRGAMASQSANAIVTVGSIRFGNALPLALIAGPCALESRAHALEMASALKELAARLKIGLLYKTSFDKANRTSANSARGLGLDQALPIFADIRTSLGVPVLTDVHEAAQCARVAQAVDVLQIPAFLCRQTDLLIAAAQT